MSLWTHLFGSSKPDPKHEEPRSKRTQHKHEAFQPKKKHDKRVRVIKCKHCRYQLKPGKLHVCRYGRRFTPPLDLSDCDDFSDFLIEFILVAELLSPDYAVDGSCVDSTSCDDPVSYQSGPEPVPEHHYSEPCQPDQNYSPPSRDDDYGHYDPPSSDSGSDCGSCGE